jgi:hypothetical protein
MARYTVTLVFEAGRGTVPQGPDVLERLPLPEPVVHRFSYCDGRTLTAVLDFRSARPASVCRATVEAIQTAWRQISGQSVGRPLSVRVRPLRQPQPVESGVARPREYAWQPDDESADGVLVLVDAGSDPITWPNGPGGQWGTAHSSISPPNRRR